MLKQPRLIARDLTNLVAKGFIADRLFIRGSAEQVAGGSARYQKSESIYTDRVAEEVASARGGYPRAGWSEAVFTEAVKDYGLEVPISFKSIRRNAMDQITRGQIKIANSLTKLVDDQMMTLLRTDVDVQTFAAGGDWSTPATDIVADISRAIADIATQDEGYENFPLTMVAHWDQWEDLVNDADIAARMPRESPNPQLTQASAARILGLDDLIFTNRATAGEVFILPRGLAGTIADEQPDPAEGYVSYQPEGDYPPISVKVYQEDKNDDHIIRGARWPAMWLAEPASVVKITAA